MNAASLLLIAATAVELPAEWVAGPPASPPAAVGAAGRDGEAAPLLLPPPTALPPVAPASVGDAASFDERMTALELALASVVTRPPAEWRLEALRREIAELKRVAGDAAQRATVEDALGRVTAFDRLARRFRRVGEDASWRSADAREGLATTARQLPSSAGNPAGVLRPVVSRRPDAPKYAVVGDNGEIAALVTPTPDLESRFRGLVGRRVGVEGQRAFRSDLRREHVVAERVTPLDTLRR